MGAAFFHSRLMERCESFREAWFVMTEGRQLHGGDRFSFRRSGSSPLEEHSFNTLGWSGGGALTCFGEGSAEAIRLLRLALCRILWVFVAFALCASSTLSGLESGGAGVANGGVSAGGLLWTSSAG
jgi:hypothetical protein